MSNTSQRASVLLALGAAVASAVAQEKPARSAQVAAPPCEPPDKVIPSGGVEWFVIGFFAGVGATLLWARNRDKNKNNNVS